MENQKKKRPAKMHSPETDLVRIAMIEEGWQVRELAEKCGLPSKTLSDAFSASVPTDTIRWRIEAAFGYTRAFWTDPATLNKRRRCVEAFGFDPYLVGRRELKKRGPAIGADFSNCPRLADHIREVFARLAVLKPQPTAPTTSAPHVQNS